MYIVCEQSCLSEIETIFKNDTILPREYQSSLLSTIRTLISQEKEFIIVVDNRVGNFEKRISFINEYSPSINKINIKTLSELI